MYTVSKLKEGAYYCHAESFVKEMEGSNYGHSMDR